MRAARYRGLFGLAPGGVYLATTCCQARGALLPHPFTLTGALLRLGGLLSAALVVGSRRPDVIWHPALWSPDFPPLSQNESGDCLANSAAHSTGVYSIMRQPSAAPIQFLSYNLVLNIQLSIRRRFLCTCWLGTFLIFPFVKLVLRLMRKISDVAPACKRLTGYANCPRG